MGHTIEMTSQIDPDKEANIQPLSGGCSNGVCKNGDAQDLSGLSLAALDTYSIKNANGISTEYKMPVAPTPRLCRPGTASGGSRTTTMVFEFPKANFGDLDELIYDPMMAYGDFSIAAATTTTTATTTITTSEDDGSSTSSEGGHSDGSSTSSEGSGGDVNTPTDEPPESDHAAGISVAFNVMFSLLAWLYLYTA